MHAPARHAPIGRLIETANNEVSRLEYFELAEFLADRLGRPTVARVTRTSNPNTITKWRLKKAVPESSRLERMREAYQVFRLLVGIGLSDINAEQWFRGKNPVLGFRMPVDVLADGDFEKVVTAVRNLSSE